jgi:hypothetical protein
LKFSVNDSLFYSSQIDSLALVDQETRTGIHAKLSRVYYKYILDSTLNKNDLIYKEALIARIKSLKADSLNIHHLLNLIDKFGFPSKSLVGSNSHDNACILFLHFDYDTLNKTLEPILDSALKQKEMSPGFYSWIIDRHRANFDVAPIYYANFNGCGNYKLLTEEKKKLVFENRKKIGLKPIACD